RRLEIPTGTFVRMIALPHFVTAADIGSDLKNGVLEITIQKTESKSTPSSSNKKTKTSLQ
ncbi:Hsp20 family protein, partial [Pseudomonas aeruginosa]